VNTKQQSFQRAGDENSSRLGIGIDYGTSNSAAAVFDGVKVTVIVLEEAAKIMPSSAQRSSGRGAPLPDKLEITACPKKPQPR
jgi:hypothetical protein